MAKPPLSPRKGIKDVFYETRVLMGREYTARRFAQEVLGGAVHPVALNYIEKGTRLPSEALVKRLAAVRKEDARPLLALLYRDRIVHTFARELRRVVRSLRREAGIEDADLAALVFHAVAALPDEGKWMPLGQWRRSFRTIPRRQGQPEEVPETLARQAEKTLIERALVEVRAGKVRRKGYHFVAQSSEERQAMALDFCALFAKGLLDKVALPDVDTGTYLRNHYLHIDPADLPEFQRELDEALTKLADRYAKDASKSTRFLNVLVTSTPFE
jgi:hypothetical protein